MKIAINGMGRIGRLLFRRLVNHPGIEIVAVNDIMPPENLAYLIRYDSIYGTFDNTVIAEGHSITAAGKKVIALQTEHPSQLPWNNLKVDVVLECSGQFSNYAGASEHLKAGAKKVLLSTTGSADIPLLIYGFNHNKATTDTHIISPGGCMTNCSVHILYILNSIGIHSAQINMLQPGQTRVGRILTLIAITHRGIPGHRVHRNRPQQQIGKDRNEHGQTEFQNQSHWQRTSGYRHFYVGIMVY